MSSFRSSIPAPDRVAKTAWQTASVGMDFAPNRSAGAQPFSDMDCFPQTFKKSTMLKVKMKRLEKSITAERKLRKQTENTLHTMKAQVTHAPAVGIFGGPVHPPPPLPSRARRAAAVAVARSFRRELPGAAARRLQPPAARCGLSGRPGLSVISARTVSHRTLSTPPTRRPVSTLQSHGRRQPRSGLSTKS
jgi:hypothetical protein